jgi:cytochrome c oxidase subunit 1
MMNERLGKIHFWLTIIPMNFIFFPMLYPGHVRHAAPARRPDPPVAQPAGAGLERDHAVRGGDARIGQIPFLFNFFWSLRNGEVAGENPWSATTLEWACPSPPPHGNFEKDARGIPRPYEYSVPGRQSDYWPQDEAA